MSLLKLPYEMVSYVLDELDLDDVWQLSLTCRHLRSLVTESNIAKRLLESKAPAATETQNARVTKNYAHELRRLLKRRQSISSVTPYLAAVVGFGEDWIYQNGVLCYIRQGQLRILNLHGSAADEVVVDIRFLLDEAIPESRKIRNYRLRPLNVSNNIVSCLYYYKKPYSNEDHFASFPTTGSLVVFSAQAHKILTARRLVGLEPNRVVVRNNDETLFIVRRSHYYRGRVVVWNAYNIPANTWHPATHLRYYPFNFQPFEIGITQCFEIFNGHIYSLSNYSELEEEEADWVSPYHCLRIPLSFNGMSKLKPDGLLRRNHLDGPMDHRWTFMKMFKDEATGEIKVVESRKEWIKGSSSTTRTYYTTTIKWPSENDSHSISDSNEGGLDGSNTNGNNFGENSSSPGGQGNSGNESDQSNAEVQPDNGSPEPGDSESNHQRCDRPPRILPPRDPRDVHPGDDSSKGPVFLRNKCPILSYHPSCQTFLDLVDDPSPSNPGKQRMRIRGGTRHRRRPEEIDDWSRCPKAKSSSSVAETHFEEVYKMYKHEEPISWPPNQDLESPNPALAQLYEILSPPNYVGEITGDWDERSFVYAAGGSGGSKQKALVFISFDPSISLAGTLPYPGPMVFGRPQSLDTTGSRTTASDNSTAHQNHGDGVRRGRQLGRARQTPRGRQTAKKRQTEKNAPTEATQVHGTKTDASWCTIEPAQYQTIRKGFHFCL
ncbi:hypothetical protein NEUTE1DRAFT_77305 [Neurospora tetrasperma FGSC 2508]|uniref:F-box domain-containing protein n=1 Tax=Neurospora tetrasperma (strain FGSC 2508 / ATCC MYA-4615 / P0657) TaxID=510951 RepID=F8MCW1_NEUT8|nr:uncharacterized protein NEUTE1DRAFT_77305 [Neurospora tetrasperma FGSC 2508]EGO61359.1 hypothetical protein NEUTE1DRAFT_77305 [Neurospora tetrasperma FGSC 2508]EGZ74618.1 hypothetical protein NEUTE2DRAFT_103525 [Neurospora tetrasperma FGSC 2509]